MTHSHLQANDMRYVEQEQVMDNIAESCRLDLEDLQSIMLGSMLMGIPIALSVCLINISFKSHKLYGNPIKLNRNKYE